MCKVYAYFSIEFILVIPFVLCDGVSFGRCDDFSEGKDQMRTKTWLVMAL